MVRDIGWGFFYGWIFFDDIFGTTNHYGTVDLFAGAYDQGCKAAGGLDHLETFPAEAVKEAFETISRNWINEGYDPLSAPLETGPRRSAPRPSSAPTSWCAASRPPDAHARARRRPPGGAPTPPATRSTAPSPTWSFDTPEIACEPGFEGQLHAINLFDHIARADVTWNPSFTAVTGASICCVTREEHMLPVIHGNDRNEWFIQLTDEIPWNIADKNTGPPRGAIVMKAGDVCCDARRHPPPGLRAQALDADGARERHARAGDALCLGRAQAVPRGFRLRAVTPTIRHCKER